MLRFSHRARDERGQAMVEFALVLPILMALLLGIIQFGIVFNNYITLTDAARAGARKAAVSRLTTGNGDAAKGKRGQDVTEFAASSCANAARIFGFRPPATKNHFSATDTAGRS